MSDDAVIYDYPHTPFKLRVARTPTGKGTWDVRDCEILRDGNVIGAFRYGYSGGIQHIFCPFQYKEQWYCLYATSYMALSLGRLTDKLEHIDSTADEFCPVEAAVPFHYFNHAGWERSGSDSDKEYIFHSYEWDADYGEPHEFAGWADFGFFCGCHWGDDTSYKLRFIDLRAIAEGKLLIDDKPLGYFDMATGGIKKDVSDFWVMSDSDHFVQFAAAEKRTFRRSKEKWTDFSKSEDEQ